MSAIIETHRGDFHVTESPRDVRAQLRGSAVTGAGAIFQTHIAGQLVIVHYGEVRKVRKPSEISRRRRTFNGVALFVLAMLLTVAGTIGICLGGSALIATVFGHAGEITWPWYTAIPGFTAYYAGGWLGHYSCDILGV